MKMEYMEENLEAPSFFAEFSRDEFSPRPGQALIFDNVFHDNSKSYDTESGMYTFPFPGIYHVTVTMTVKRRTTMKLELMHNGDVVTSIEENYRGTSSQIIRAQRGDQLWVRKVNHGGSSLCKHTGFSSRMVSDMDT